MRLSFSVTGVVRSLRIKDHGLLADFYFAILEAARAFVHVQNRTSRVQLCIHKAKTARDCASPEQALSGTKNDRKLPNTEGIDEIVLEEGLDEVQGNRI